MVSRSTRTRCSWATSQRGVLEVSPQPCAADRRRSSGANRITLSRFVRMALTSKQRAILRAAAHHLTAAVHVGHQGLSETLRGSVDDALRTRELVKIQFSKTTDVD